MNQYSNQRPREYTNYQYSTVGITIGLPGSAWLLNVPVHMSLRMLVRLFRKFWDTLACSLSNARIFPKMW